MTTSVLTDFAADQQRHFDTSTSSEDRKERGHFGTPPAIAEFMAGMFSGVAEGVVRILDAGAGVGTLSAAVCQQALGLSSAHSLYFELWENDISLFPFLKKTMTNCRASLRASGRDMEFAIRSEDFILANTQQSLFDAGPEPSFHAAILNPPYFKIGKHSQQALAMKHIVHGQPNIYALFMAVAAELLLPQGEMVAITPRSYFNGPYFKQFRKWFFERMTARQIHIFQSRTEAFKGDGVLQETVILHAEKGGQPDKVALTTSMGRNPGIAERIWVPYEQVIDNSHGDQIVRVTASGLESEVVAVMDSLPCRFRDLGFEISTGPVVTFRSTEFLRREQADNTAPLLWMHNVRPFVTQFPTTSGKPTHIEVSKASRRLLVPSKTYVLLKRFTAKEEKKRLVAGIIQPSDSYSRWVGLENHLNYVYRKGSELSRHEAYGLAAFFNSSLVDRYFRAISGNTQVNATEIRVMPFPDAATLVQIGEELERLPTIDCRISDEIVCQSLSLPKQIRERLLEAAP